MCGISGIVSIRPTNPDCIQAMNDVQRHRGPDGSGIWQSDDRMAVLGHRRLAIIDLSDAASQPMVSTNGGLVITYNGEIYNYVELRAELEALGVSFRTKSDTEVILEAYRQWGDACLQRFNGMFAFAILDESRRRLFCARDRYGEKPFLFSAKREFFAFSSEYKALLQLSEVRRDFDELRLLRAAHMPSAGFDSDRQTVFADIQQLLPSEALELDTRSLECRIWRYWDVRPALNSGPTTQRDATEAFSELFRDSVCIRLRSDVEVGSCLSGGLDSSAIACTVRRLIGPSAVYHTFTGRFPGTPADEWEFATEVISAVASRSHVVVPSAERFVDELPRFVWYNELPVGSTSQFAQWCVFALAKESGVTVLLDGQGSDEQLGGYEQYFDAYIRSLIDLRDSARIDRELPAIRERYPLALRSSSRRWRDSLPFSLRHWMSNRFGLGTNPMYGVRRDVAEMFKKDQGNPDPAGFSALGGVLYQDTFARFLTTLLRYGDRNSMAHSREVRLPFCDHRIAELVFSLPPHFLMGEVQTKRLLRESMRGVMPEKIRSRWNKRGFLPPQDLWFQSRALLDLVRDTLSSRTFIASDYWLPSWWQSALRRLERGELRLGWTIWQPFVMETWKRHFVGALGASVSVE